MVALILLHLFLVFGGRFFISPELTVFPYLTGRGLVPYQGLIDQHFPLLFYGPINLSFFGLTTPLSTLILFVAVIIVTDLFALSIFKGRPLIFLTFVICQFLLGGNYFWVESFVLLCLAGYLFLSRINYPFIGGLLLSFAIGLRPTLLPFVLLLIYFNKGKRVTALLTLAIFPLLEVLWLMRHRLWDDFMAMMAFNSKIYADLAFQLPTRFDLIVLAIVVTPILIFAVSSKKIVPTILLFISALILGYPRFDLTDLLPVAAIIIYLNVDLTRQTRRLVLIWIFLTLVFIIYRRWDFMPTNYYYPKTIRDQASQISKAAAGRQVYFFGGPDQLYQMTNSVPVGDYYLPSLPWYMTPSFVDRQIQALRDHPNGLIVVNTDSRLKGVSLLDYAKPIWDYIQTHYHKTATLNNLELYENSN